MVIEPGSLWSRVLEKLQNSTPDYAFKHWFSQIREIEQRDGRLTLGVPNLFVRDWVLDHYGEFLRKAVHSVAGAPLDIAFTVDTRTPAPGAKDGSAKPGASADGVDFGVVEAGAERPRARLRDHFSFDNFVVGPSNQLAHAAAMAVADNPGKTYNPLFIYGGTGLGKTHLLHAIGNRIRQRNPNARVVYTSAENYLNEFVVLLRKGRMEDFRRAYREEVDVLLVDDIQSIKRAQETQNEFFYTFNELYDAQKAIVLTSDIHPNELDKIESRLRTRFLSGLTADIFEPPFEVRLAIIKRKAELENVHLPDDVAHFIAQSFNKNVRELEGALTKVAAHASLTHRLLTVAYAEEILRDSLPAKQALTIEHIQAKVSRYYNLEVQDLLGEKRTRPIARARAVAMYFARKLVSDASFPVIGARFGGKHHTTVMSAVEKIVEERAKVASFSRELEEIERQITGG